MGTPTKARMGVMVVTFGLCGAMWLGCSTGPAEAPEASETPEGEEATGATEGSTDEVAAATPPPVDGVDEDGESCPQIPGRSAQVPDTAGAARAMVAGECHRDEGEMDMAVEAFRRSAELGDEGQRHAAFVALYQLEVSIQGPEAWSSEATDVECRRLEHDPESNRSLYGCGYRFAGHGTGGSTIVHQLLVGTEEAELRHDIEELKRDSAFERPHLELAVLEDSGRDHGRCVVERAPPRFYTDEEYYGDDVHHCAESEPVQTRARKCVESPQESKCPDDSTRCETVDECARALCAEVYSVRNPDLEDDWPELAISYEEFVSDMCGAYTGSVETTDCKLVYADARRGIAAAVCIARFEHEVTHTLDDGRGLQVQEAVVEEN